MTKADKTDVEFKLDVAKRLATIETEVKNIPALMQANHNVISEQLKPILELHQTVQEHDRQIARWQGINGFLGVLLTIAGAALGRIKHWF